MVAEGSTYLVSCDHKIRYEHNQLGDRPTSTYKCISLVYSCLYDFYISNWVDTIPFRVPFRNSTLAVTVVFILIIWVT